MELNSLPFFFENMDIENELVYLTDNWFLIAKKDQPTLDRLADCYFYLTKKKADFKDNCKPCITNIFNTIKEHKFNIDMAKSVIPERKYILKPGRHQMVPMGCTYTNETLTDEQAEAFIAQNPNLKIQFLKYPE